MGERLDLPEVFDYEGRAVRYGAIGDGEPLVLVHGTPFSSAVWRRIAPLLAAERRVFYFDLLGYGQSEMRAGDDVSLGVQNLLLASLLDHWGVERPDVIAHDFGGATALRAHLLNGCDYRSLMLVDPVALSPWGSPLVQHVRQHEAAFAGAPAYIHDAILDAYISGAARRPLGTDALALYSDPWRGDIGQPGFYRQIAQMDQRYTDEIEPLLGGTRCPVTLLWGEQDGWIPVDRGLELAARVPHLQFFTVPDCGHLVQEDAPEAIVGHWMRTLR